PGSVLPPQDWPVRTYMPTETSQPLNSANRVSLSAGDPRRLQNRLFRRLRHTATPLAPEWLAKVIQHWRPDIIHTLGLDPAGQFYFDARKRFALEGIGKWVLQLRGGSDLTLSRLDPALAPRIAEVLRASDQLISDNDQNFDFARQMGIRD